MISVRNSQLRGYFDFGWLRTHHTFSFGEYFDPENKRFSSLRVINEDEIEADHGFESHSHRNMEIITFVQEGILRHKDSLGNCEDINAGEVQRITAGTGIEHSEFNPSKTSLTKIFQIWIFPDKLGYPPSYEQRSFQDKISNQKLTLIASKEGSDGSVHINQDAKVFIGNLKQAQTHSIEINKDRKYFIQLMEGEVVINNVKLGPGDSAKIEEESFINFESELGTKFLFFDLA